MTPVNYEVTPAPVQYTPVYCEAIRAACTQKMDAVDAKVDTLTTQVDRVEGRIYSLLIMAIIQLMAIAGGVIGIWMVNHTTAVAAAETVVKAVIKP